MINQCTTVLVPVKAQGTLTEAPHVDLNELGDLQAQVGQCLYTWLRDYAPSDYATLMDGLTFLGAYSSSAAANGGFVSKFCNDNIEQVLRDIGAAMTRLAVGCPVTAHE